MESYSAHSELTEQAPENMNAVYSRCDLQPVAPSGYESPVKVEFLKVGLLIFHASIPILE